MDKLIYTLRNEGCSCVIANGSDMRTFTQRGVADLYNLMMNDAEFLKGASVADKVIGKAAAALVILGGVTMVYAEVISRPALLLLRDAGVDTYFHTVVPYIRNRDGNSQCPLDRACYNEDTAQDILPRIEFFMTNIINK